MRNFPEKSLKTLAGRRRHVWEGKARHTTGYLSKRDLKENRRGKIVSRKKSALGRRNAEHIRRWTKCVRRACDELDVPFAVKIKGTETYKLACEYYYGSRGRPSKNSSRRTTRSRTTRRGSRRTTRRSPVVSSGSAKTSPACRNDTDLFFEPMGDVYLMTRAGNCITRDDARDMIEAGSNMVDPYTNEPLTAREIGVLRRFATTGRMPRDRRL